MKPLTKGQKGKGKLETDEWREHHQEEERKYAQRKREEARERRELLDALFNNWD